MGWSSGTAMAVELWKDIRELVPEENRKQVAIKLYDAVCALDADDWDGESQLEIDAEVYYDED